MLILQNNDPSLEDLSKYKKRGFEYVEEEKMILDALVVLYHKRLEIAQNQLKALEELYSTTVTSLDASNSLYKLFVHPVIDCLCKDIEIYTQYVQNAEQDLARITFPSGPRAEASSIEQDLDAVKRLYPEYSDSCAAVLKLPPPSPPKKRLSSEDIEHRRIAAKLHPKQKVARTHFETSYPKLLGDHMEYMEQVRSLVWDNTTRRSELSTTIACNATAEKVFIDRFSTTDAIAVPYEKLELEQSRPEYQHAPVFNPLTRNLEDVPIVILGRDIDSGSEEDFTAELLVACLERYLVAPYRDVDACPEDSWATIRRMESSQSIQNVYDIVSSLPHSGVVEELLEVVMMNSGMSVPLLNLTNQTSARKLRENPLNRSALIDLMKDVNHSIKRILKACALAYIAEGHPIAIFRAILLRRDTPFYSIFWPLETILRRWDCDEWCPLAENVVWGVKRFKDKPPSLFRTRRFPSKFGGEVYMEVDQEGNVMDTLRNERRKVYIKEQSFSIKKLRKLMS